MIGADERDEARPPGRGLSTRTAQSLASEPEWPNQHPPLPCPWRHPQQRLGQRHRRLVRIEQQAGPGRLRTPARPPPPLPGGRSPGWPPPRSRTGRAPAGHPPRPDGPRRPPGSRAKSAIGRSRRWSGHRETAGSSRETAPSVHSSTCAGVPPIPRHPTSSRSGRGGSRPGLPDGCGRCRAREWHSPRPGRSRRGRWSRSSAHGLRQPTDHAERRTPPTGRTGSPACHGRCSPRKTGV